MDASHRYTRPPHHPPPSAVDPHYYQYQQQQQQPPPGAPPVPPPQPPWYANQFQYNASNSQSPSPPPPWPQPPLHSDHLNPHMPSSAYPPPPPPPYPGYQPPAHGQFPPRPFPPPPPQHLNSYPPQEWNNSNLAHQQNWNHPEHSDSEDWAARAKAWATAKASTENQTQQGHYTPSGRQEEQNRHRIPYSQAVESQYTENHQRSPMMSGYQQHPVSTPHLPGQPTHFHEHASTSAGSSSYVLNGNLTHSATDGASYGDQNVAFHPDPLPANPLIHQPEVPSSYSSVSGKEDQMERRSDFSVPAAHEAMHHLHAPIPTDSGMAFQYGNHDSMSNLANKPLEFTSRFNINHDQNSVPQSGYAYHDSSLQVRGGDTVVNTWNSSMAPNVPYSSVPPHFPSVPQHDPSIHVLATVSGHSAPSFPRFAGPNFQPTVPSPGGPFVPGAGPPAGFSVDAYNLPGISERPKKAPVPNWLREEIIKKKASITSSSAGHPNYEAQSGEDEVVDKSFEKGDLEDSKSIESPRSTEEEDADEDCVEAAKTAAVNQEIKRILTEVLLKVTDELFDEIATKVLNEDDAAADGHRVSPSSQAAPTPKASGKGPMSVETMEQTKENDSQNSTSSSAGNILGLANYASDDDNDAEEMHASKQSDSIKRTNLVDSGDEKRLSALQNAGENGTSEVKVEEHDTAQANLDRYSQRTSLSVSRNNDSTSNSKMEKPYHLNSPKGSSSAEFGKVNHERSGSDGVDSSRLKEATGLRQNLHDGDVGVGKSSTYNSRDTESTMKSSRKDGNKNSSGVESSKEPQIAKVKEDVKLDENPKSKDDRHVRKEKTGKYDSKDTKKDRDKVKDGDKIDESERRKRSNHPDASDDHKGRERYYRENVGDDCRRERKDKEEDKHRHKSSRDMGKHDRRRSSSTSSRGRSSKDNDVSHAKNSSDDASDYSRRKGSARKRNLSRSPSPVKSRRRQVSRSPPHSKHTQRRHSPYSSLESSRGKRRSRSKSPVRRRER